MSALGASAVGSFVDAILSRLKADAGLTALVGAQVYDVVPSKEDGIKPPWIYLGPAGTKRQDDSGYRGWLIRQRIFCITDSFGRDPAWAIAEAVDLALDDIDLMLAAGCGFTSGNALKMIDSGDLIDPDALRSVFTDVVGIVYRDAPLVAGA